MEQRLLVPNGIQFETGEYAYSPATVEEFAAWVRRQPEREDVEDLQLWVKGRERRLRDRKADAGDLSQAGWGIIFAQNDERTFDLLKALRPLLDLRKSQVGIKRPHYYRELVSEEGYKAGDTKDAYLRRFGVGPDAVEPAKMPYYLLIVGGPEEIPWDFQYELDIEYAVGRICFDTLAEYERYACQVVAAETEPPKQGRTAAFFAVEHEGDPATELSVRHLAEPLAKRARDQAGWEVNEAFRQEATKVRLRRLLGGDETPDFLFTASHGMVLRRESAVLQEYQGSIVCREHPGPNRFKGPAPREFFFCANDLCPETERLRGMISFHFACYSAGSPRENDFRYESDAAAEVAPQPFVARLPQRLLAHPRGGALAVIGHIETAWPSSIEWGGAGQQIQPFEDALDMILQGRPVGEAMEVFGERFARLSVPLAKELQRLRNRGPEDPEYLATLWIACNDARNYIVLGDPAVRLPRPAASA